MARKLVFTDDKLFQNTYEGFLVTAKGNNPKEHRLIDKILTRFEEISMEDPESKQRVLDTTRDRTMVLEDAEYEFMKTNIQNLAGPASLSRVILRVQDLIDKAEAGDAKQLARTASPET